MTRSLSQAISAPHKRRRESRHLGSDSPSCDIPSKARTAATQSSLAQERENLLLDLDETVPEIDRSFFETHLLPPSPLPSGVTTESIVANLIASGHAKVEEGWKWWRQPSDSTASEDKFFGKFEFLAEDILSACRNVPLVKTTRFVCNPKAKPESSSRENTSKPDAYALRNPVESSVTTSLRWVDVAVPAEFKKANHRADREDNRVKVLWSMNHMMREDARRRFVIGFTIEDSNMRYWFCSRSDVFMSTSFDMLKDRAALVDFIFRIAYATEEQLGWDQSIKLVALSSNNDKPQYDITVTDDDTATTKTFRTKKMISNIGADTLRGRGTRVWEAMELDAEGHEKGGETCVLKDCWVDDDRDREGKIMAQIRADAKAAQARADRLYANAPASQKPEPSTVYKTIDKSLLTVVTYGDVRTGERADKTRNWAMPKFVSLKKVHADPKAKVVVKTSLAPSGAFTVETGTESSKLIYTLFTTKVHHRLVLKEVGTPIREVESLAKTFVCIGYVFVALRALHSIGWVHRDISSGNILVIGKSAKIADFEYAKHENDFSTHGVRTGTPYFMATEVDSNHYLHSSDRTEPAVPANTPSTSDLVGTLEAASEALARAPLEGTNANDELPGAPVAAPPTATKTLTSFRHNPLHDMESLVWLSLYLLLIGVLVKAGDTTPEQLSELTKYHHALSRELFSQQAVRRDVMNDVNFLRTLVSGASLHPQAEIVGFHLANMTRLLISAYFKAERTLDKPIKFTVAEDTGLTTKLGGELKLLIEYLVKNDIIVTVDAKSCKILQQALFPAKPELQRTSSSTVTRRFAELPAGEDSDETDAPAPKKPKTEASSDSSQ